METVKKEQLITLTVMLGYDPIGKEYSEPFTLTRKADDFATGNIGEITEEERDTTDSDGSSLDNISDKELANVFMVEFNKKYTIA